MVFFDGGQQIPERPDYQYVSGIASGFTAPTSVRDAGVVIVGGGPCGLFAAAVLHGYGMRRVTVVERAETERETDVSRAYLFSLSVRGQAIVREILGLLEYLRGHSATPEGVRRCDVAMDTKARPLNPWDGYKPGLMFLRSRFVRALRGWVRERCPEVCVMYGARVECIAFEEGGVSRIDCAQADGSRERLEGRLVLACDGANSVVVAALRAAEAEAEASADGSLRRVVKSTRGFAACQLTSDVVGWHARSVVLHADAFRHVEVAALSAPLRTYWTYVRGREFDLVAMPILPDDEAHLGGLLAIVVRPPDNPVWRIADVEDGFAIFQANFPQLHVRDCVSPQSMRAFIAGRGITFAPLSHPRSLVARVGLHDDDGGGGGVVIMGDAAHYLLPDSGQGLNSALEDVAILAQALGQAPGTASLQDVLARYEARRNPDVSALVELYSFAGQWRDESRVWRCRRKQMDNWTRAFWSRRFPSVFYPQVFAMNGKGWSYAVMRRRYRLTTYRLIVVSVACVFAAVMLSCAIGKILRYPFQ